MGNCCVETRLYEMHFSTITGVSLILAVAIWLALIEAVARRCSVKKVFLEVSQNSQENICAKDSFLIKLQGRPLVAAPALN